MDYHKAAKTIATTIELGCSKALTGEQFTLMAGAVAVMFEKAATDERTDECEAIIALLLELGALDDGTYLEAIRRRISALSGWPGKDETETER